MARQQVGLDQGEVGQGAGGGIELELGEGDEVGGEAIPEARHVDEPGEGDGVGLEHVDLPGPPAALETVEDRLRRVVAHEIGDRPVHDEARRRRGCPERPVGQGLRRDLAEPVVEHPEAPGQRAEHRDLIRGEARHDLAVLLVRGLPAELDGEEADVVGDEPVHRRLLALRRCVVGRHHVDGILEAVGIVQHVEQLGVGVGILLPGVRVRHVHAAGDPVRHDAAGCPVLGPGRHGIAEVLPDHPLEGVDFARRVETPEQIVERPVLEQHEHHVVHRVPSCRSHRLPLWSARPTTVRHLRLHRAQESSPSPRRMATSTGAEGPPLRSMAKGSLLARPGCAMSRGAEPFGAWAAWTKNGWQR